MYIHSYNYSLISTSSRRDLNSFSVKGSEKEASTEDIEPVTVRMRDFFNSRAMEVNSGGKPKVNFYI